MSKQVGFIWGPESFVQLVRVSYCTVTSGHRVLEVQDRLVKEFSRLRPQGLQRFSL